MKKMRNVQSNSPAPANPFSASDPPASGAAAVSDAPGPRPPLTPFPVQRPAVAWPAAQDKPAGWPAAPNGDRPAEPPPPAPSEAAPDAENRAPAIPWPGAARPVWPLAPTNGSSHPTSSSTPGWSLAAAPVVERPLTLSPVEPPPARQSPEPSPTRVILAPPAPAPVPPDPAPAPLLSQTENGEAQTEDIWDERARGDEPKKEDAKPVIPWRPALRPPRSASEMDEEVSRLLETQRALKQTVSRLWLGLGVSAVLALSGMYQARQARQIALNKASVVPAVVTPVAAASAPRTTPAAAPPTGPNSPAPPVNTSAVLPAVPVSAAAPHVSGALQSVTPAVTDPAVITFTQIPNGPPPAPQPADRKLKRTRHNDN